MRKHSKVTEGFTLIELLVVTAIIGILAALILAAVGGGKANAQRTGCVNNLRQIALGVRMYSDDAHDASPSPVAPGLQPARMGSLFSGYKALMKTYVGLNGASSPQDKLFACPADELNLNCFFARATPPLRFVAKSCHSSSNFDYSSYAFNGGDNVTRHYEDRSFMLPGLTGVKLSSVRHPGRTILLTEIPALMPYSWHDPFSHGLADTNGLIYNDSKNVASFVDGHVSYIKMYYKSPMCAFLTNPPACYEYQWSPD